MSPYQHLFSTNAVLNVWRNLRANNRDPNDLLLTVQYHPDDVRTPHLFKNGFGKSHAIETSSSAVEEGDPRGKERGRDGRSIGFVVPWRSMQSQRRELKEKEKELAEALVVLAGEVSFIDLPESLQSSLTHNPLIQIRHLAAGLSRQLSAIELQMADNAAYARGKNLYTGGEIARKFLPPIDILFSQRPVPQRMIFELMMELKDLVYAGMAECEKEVAEWELEGFGTLEEVDEVLVRTLAQLPASSTTAVSAESAIEGSSKKQLLPPPSHREPEQRGSTFWLHDPAEILYHLESLETTSTAMTHLSVPITDFLAKTTITLRRLLPRPLLIQHAHEKKRRNGRCAEYARCMKWAGTAWRQGGGCRRGCENEDEDPKGLPCWHSSSRNFDTTGTSMFGNGALV